MYAQRHIVKPRPKARPLLIRGLQGGDHEGLSDQTPAVKPRYKVGLLCRSIKQCADIPCIQKAPPPARGAFREEIYGAREYTERIAP